jgi:hypothetical protein
MLYEYFKSNSNLKITELIEFVIFQLFYFQMELNVLETSNVTLKRVWFAQMVYATAKIKFHTGA